MKFLSYVLLLICISLASCKLMHPDRSIKDNKALARMLNDYYDNRMRYYPIEATQNGDNRYNDQLPVDFTDSYLDTLKRFYGDYLQKIGDFNRDKLNHQDQISYDIFKREMKMQLEGIDLHFAVNSVWMPNLQYMPFNQFEGLPVF